MNKKIQLLPVMLCFFAMGFVDLVGIASNYVQADLGLFGGTVFPLLMGFASDAVGQVGAVAVMTIGVLYLFFFVPKVAK